MAVLPFISKSTEHLYLRMDVDVEVETAQKLLRCIIQRRPNLKTLSLDSIIWPEYVEDSLAQLISNSRQLESALPRYYQSQAIVEALGRLPQLKRLAVNYELYQMQPFEEALRFLPGRFLRLKDVEIHAPVPEATRLLSEFQSAAQLQHLTVSCERLKMTHHVSSLVATIAQRCPALQTLSFNFCSRGTTPRTANFLTFSTFRPVLSCHSLTSFRIGFGSPIKMTELEFLEMASAWPNLRVLVLCPDSKSSHGGLSWNMLPTIAYLFPYLEQLSTNFSSTDEVKFSGDILPLGEFRLLKELGVGAASTVPKDKTALGFLIGAHCRLPISISFDWFKWDTAMRSAEDKEKWLEVESIARRAVEVKQEIRRRWHFRENDGMEFAVQTPELLLAVFSSVERKHLTAAARVCQKWSTLALDFIWRDLDSVVPLVELIVPLKCADGLLRPWELSDLQTECSWNRYDAYADRVRTIQFDDTSGLRAGRNQAITPELLRKVASLHPWGGFFPRHLRALKWWAEVQESALAMVPFLCGSLEEVLINFDVDEETAKAVIEQAAMQTPRLKSLCFDVASPETPLENSLAVWISKSPLLESIALPRYYQTPTIVHALCNLNFLKHLNVNYTGWNKRVGDYQYFCSTSVAFIALQKLEIDAPVDQLTQLFQVSERFPQLDEAILSSADLESSGQILKLTKSLAQQCPDITLIALIFYRHDTDQSCDISFQHIRPLLGCRNLGVLEIGHNRPFRMNENDLEEMGAAWLRIRELSLCSKPARWNRNPVPGGVPLRLLPVMAAVFPMVQILGIYIDSKDVPTFDHNIIPSVQFQALRVLDVGASGAPACSPLTAGFFIGALCKSEVQIVRGSVPRGGYRGGYFKADPEWDDVHDVIRMLVLSKKRIHEDWELVPRLGTTKF